MLISNIHEHALFLNQKRQIKQEINALDQRPPKKKKKIQQIGHDLISGVQLVVTKSEGVYTCTYVLVPISA